MALAPSLLFPRRAEQHEGAAAAGGRAPRQDKPGSAVPVCCHLLPSYTHLPPLLLRERHFLTLPHGLPALLPHVFIKSPFPTFSFRFLFLKSTIPSQREDRGILSPNPSSVFPFQQQSHHRLAQPRAFPTWSLARRRCAGAQDGGNYDPIQDLILSEETSPH